MTSLRPATTAEQVRSMKHSAVSGEKGGDASADAPARAAPPSERSPQAVSGKAGIAIASAMLLLAGCYSADEREANRRESAQRFARQGAETTFLNAYRSCIYRVTGPFASASIEVMKECERQGCLTIAERRASVQPVQCRPAIQGARP